MPPAMAPIRSEADPWETVVEVVALEVLAMDEVAEVGAEIAFEAVLKVAVARELGSKVEKSAVHKNCGSGHIRTIGITSHYCDLH